MNSEKENKPSCFGNLDSVFPMGDDGLRISPDSCRIECEYRTECLKSALEGSKGDSVQAELLDRKYESGKIGFFERWAKKKTLGTNNKK